MRTFKLAMRNVAGSRRGQLGKIVFLGAGLAAGLMLLTKVWFEHSYDDFYPDSDRVYQLASVWGDPEDPEHRLLFKSSGGYAPLLKDNLPQVELASRFIHFGFGSGQVFYVGPDRQRLSASGIIADEYFYDMLPRPMIAGDAKEILTTPLQVMISKKVADMINGDPIGQTMEFDNYPGKPVTIAGIFEDVPKNTRLPYDFVIPLVSIVSFEGGDGSMRLVGNDRYMSFVKLREGTDVDEFQAQVHRLVAAQDEIRQMKEEGWEFGIRVALYRDAHKMSEATKRTSLVLMILAVSILFATVFNYLLVVLSDTMARGKSVAVMKSYGAGFREIARSVMAETTIQMVVLLATATVLALLFRNTAEQLLGNSIADLLTWRSGLWILAIVVFIILLSSYVQARVYDNIPVSSVFRSYRSTGRLVKLGLLFVQVTAAAFLAVLLMTVIRQYNTMINDDPGYEYDRLLVTWLSGVEDSRKQALVSELEGLDVVEGVSLGSVLPMYGMSGNNIIDPLTGQELFNIADLEFADHNYLPILGIEVTEGRPFEQGRSATGDVLVSRKFIERIKDFYDWPDGVVGKDLKLTSYGDITITGVYEDFILGNSVYRDRRPSLLVYSESYGGTLLIKMRELGTDAVTKVNTVLETMLPEKEISVGVYADMMLNIYRDHLNFRKSITIASIIVMIIVLVGLIGYMRDETTRRQKEIAVRKINGATVGDILTILGTGVLKMMAPAMVIGIVVSYFVAQKWMQAFAVKASFSIPLALLCAVVLAVVALTAVSLSTLRVARKNPAETIKTE